MKLEITATINGVVFSRAIEEIKPGWTYVEWLDGNNLWESLGRPFVASADRIDITIREVPDEPEERDVSPQA